MQDTGLPLMFCAGPTQRQPGPQEPEAVHLSLSCTRCLQGSPCVNVAAPARSIALPSLRVPYLPVSSLRVYFFIDAFVKALSAKLGSCCTFN